MVHRLPVKIRVSETDALGHVSNISYFIYLEEARVELFRNLGIMEEIGRWPFILASTTCDYIQQSYFGQHLEVESSVSRIGNSSFHIDHEIYGEQGLTAKGKAVVVHFDFDEQKTKPLTPDMIETLKSYRGGSAVTPQE
ncbi:acyl-CoA thioesterase [Thalassorhabdus alkalitolerans]|uniref:Acyl-CoA thioesterase n=1 Tax=Thalassorhabdus alkalitolerans TaxID=2282697 RepID=A0ABW0YIS7_9BACI|nr:thioesterase family protein [Thalassobacillus sp. C254]